jgi:hypothetical protein
MSNRFYNGQRDYVPKLNDMEDDVANLTQTAQLAAQRASDSADDASTSASNAAGSLATLQSILDDLQQNGGGGGSSSVFRVINLDDTGGIPTPDLTANTTFILSMSQDGILRNPSNVTAGTVSTLLIQQNGNGGHVLTLEPNYKFINGQIPVLSTTTGMIDALTLIVMSPSVVLCDFKKGFIPTASPNPSSTLLMDASTLAEYHAAIAAASLGNKRAAGATALINAIGNTPTLTIYRSAVQIVAATFSSGLTTTTDEFNTYVNLGTLSSTGTVVAGDISTGSWTFELKSGTGRMLVGKVAGPGIVADITLAESTTPTSGFDFDFKLIMPRQIDGFV